MKKIFISTAVALSLATQIASAADLTAKTEIKDRNLSIEGSGAEKSFISLYLLKEDELPENASPENLPAFIEAIKAASDGSFTANYILPKNLGTGKYKVSLVCGEDSWMNTEPMVYINSTELESLALLINDTDSAQEIADILEPYEFVFIIPDKDFTMQYLYNARPSSGYTNETFNNAIELAAALTYIKSGEANDKIEVYEKLLKTEEFDCYEMYSNLNEETKPAFLEKLAAADLANNKALQTVYETGLLINALASQSWQELEVALQGGEDENKYFEKYIAEDTDYSSLKYPEKVYQELFEDLEDMKTFEDIKEAFASAAEDLYDEQKKSEKKSSGGGGGGGGSRGVISLGSPVVKEEAPQQNVPETTPEVVPEKSPFNDIDGHWGKEKITALVEKGIISGYPDGSFKPENKVTRAEFVKMICVMKNLEAASGEEVSFSDVSADKWYASYINAAVKAGIVTGDGNGSFNPEKTVTRQDAAVMLSRALSFGESSYQLSFADSAEIDAYATNAIKAMCETGILSGMTDGGFYPKKEATRAEASTMLLNALSRIEQEGGIG